MLRLISDWLERRRILKEFEDDQKRSDMSDSLVMRSNLKLALSALHSNDTLTANKILEDCRKSYPRLLAKTTEGLELLFGLGFFDEVEKHIDTMLAADSHSVVLWKIYAQLPERNNNISESIKRWQAMIKHMPTNPIGFCECAHALVRAKQPREAEEVLLRGIKRCPDVAFLPLEYARVALAQRNWAEALTRFKQAEASEPSQSMVGAAQALQQLGRIEEADDILRRACQLFSHDPTPNIEFAWLATNARNWSEAAARWMKVREFFPGHTTGYWAGAAALREVGDYDASDRVLESAIDKQMGDYRLYLEHARNALIRANWPEAEKRFTRFRELFPDREEGYLQAAEAAAHARGQDAAQALRDLWLAKSAPGQ